MITQEDIDAMEDGMLIRHGDGTATYIERGSLQERIEQLEWELAGIRAELDPQPSHTWPTNMAVRALQQALAAEKALADRLYAARMGDLAERCSAGLAYRKARGL